MINSDIPTQAFPLCVHPHERCGDDARASSLPLAVQDGPPVVRPGQESPLGRAGGLMLVVAGGEQDVLPRWLGLHS